VGSIPITRSKHKKAYKRSFVGFFFDPVNGARIYCNQLKFFKLPCFYFVNGDK
jgi:hypothetical protein